MIQVYTGNGKGKTTAALGLALRAAGAGMPVYIGQFIKKGCYHELRSLKKFKQIKVEQFGRGCFIRGRPLPKDRALAGQGLKKIRAALSRRKYGLVILDELNIALKLELLKINDVLALLKGIPKRTEVVITGRFAHPEILKMADLVSEIREKKHYYRSGIGARKGIEF